MWVHYAKNHTGFVVGFNCAAPFFRENGRTLSKVIYQDRPNIMPEPDLNACFHKSKVWSHEKEWRCVRQFETGESRMAEIPDDLITHVVFGAKMEPWLIAQVMIYVTAYELRDIQFFQSVASHKSWSFENEPKEMAMCEDCRGNGYLMGDV
jgi:hypothetical protein